MAWCDIFEARLRSLYYKLFCQPHPDLFGDGKQMDFAESGLNNMYGQFYREDTTSFLLSSGGRWGVGLSWLGDKCASFRGGTARFILMVLYAIFTNFIPASSDAVCKILEIIFNLKQSYITDTLTQFIFWTLPWIGWRHETRMVRLPCKLDGEIRPYLL